jgi:hypothetical protein
MGCEVLEMDVAKISSSGYPIIGGSGELPKRIGILEIETPEGNCTFKYHLVSDINYV